MKSIKTLLKQALGALFVDEYNCIICDEELSPNRYGLCEECRLKLPFISDEQCVKCGKPIHNESQLCSNCADTERYFGKARSCLVYEEEAARLVKRFKLDNQRYLAKYFAKMMMDVYVNEGFHADFLIAVPISQATLRDRGFNQSELLAEELSKLVNVPVIQGLDKIRETASQVSVSGIERRKNLEGAFALKNKELLKGKRIVLIDDILTTGSTLSECAKTLTKARAAEINCLTVANTPLKSI